MTRTTKVISWSLIGAAALAAAAATAWNVQSSYTSVYTDGDRIAVPAALAPLRSILWQPATPVPGGINTTADEYEPRISADGARMIFVRGKPGANADLFESRWTPDGWSPPAPIPSINTTSDELGPELSRDGQTLYFYSDRPGGHGGFDLWLARADADGWREPENLGPAINTEHNEYGPALTPDGAVLYFSSNRPRAGEPPRQRDAWPATVRESRDRHDYDLYRVSRITDGPSQPEPVAALNSTFDEGSPCLSPAGDFLYFASDRPGGLGGFDLYRARLLRGEIQPPEPLGPAINSPANDLDPALSMDGFRLCFSSSRRAPAASPAPESDAIDYGLWTTSSREVYLQSDSAAARAALMGLLQRIAPWLLLLLPLGLLFFALRDPRFRRGFGRLSLLAQCVLISLMIHAIVASLLAVWKVGSQIGDFISEGGGNRVILASSGITDGVITQMRGDASESPFSVASFADNRAELMPALLRLELQPTTSPDSASWQDSHALPLDTSHDLNPAPTSTPSITAATPPQTPSPDAQTPQDLAPAASVTEAAMNSPRLPAATDPLSPTPAPSLAASQVTLAPAASASDSADLATPLPASGLSQSSPPVAASVPTDPSPPAPLPSRTQDARTPTDTAPSAAATEATLRAPAPSITTAPAPTISGSTVAAQRVSLAPATSSATPQSDAAPLAPAAASVSTSSPESLPAARMTAPVQTNPAAAQAALPVAAAPAGAASESRSPTTATLATPSTDRAALHVAALASSTVSELPIAGAGNARPDNATPAPIAAQSFASPQSTPTASTAPIAHAGQESLPAPKLPQTSLAAPRAATNAEASLPPAAPAGSAPRAQLATGTASRVDAPTTHLSPTSTALSSSTPDSRALTLPLPAANPSPASLPALAAAPPGQALPGGAMNPRLPAQEPEPTPLDTLAQRAPESRGDLLNRMGGSAETERAVGLALEWLSTHQAKDGHWSGRNFDDGQPPSGGAAEIDSDAAMTGLSLLCFLGAGHTHTADGPYRENVQRALDWLLARQDPAGDLRRDPARPQAPSETMYSHNIATVALCEAFAMTRDPKLTQAARRAVAFMVSIQANPDPRRSGARAKTEDTSVIGWQIMAMHSARNSGFAVPQSAFDAASRWLDSVAAPNSPGRYAYQRGKPPSPAMTAEAMFVRQILGGQPAEPRMRDSARFVLDTPPRWEAGAPTHYWYYATLALFQHQGEEWKRWNEQLVPQLLQHQHQTGPARGTWDPHDEWSRLGGRIYQTAVCTLSLEVYYRYQAPKQNP